MYDSMIRNRVSVIIPVFNRGKCLREAVMSVLLQTHKEVEIIIIDDGSTDNTLLVAQELAAKWPQTITVFWQKNSGPGSAREMGTVKSSGEFIQYLDSDDILMSHKLESQVQALRDNSECGISYGISYQADYRFNPPIVSGPLRSTGNKLKYLFPKLLNERWWTTSCPLYRRTIVNTIGSWKCLLNEEDWEFDARAGEIHTPLAWVHIGVSVRRINLSDDHLSFGGCTDVNKLSDRVFAKNLLFQYAVHSGLQQSASEMRVFSRECFLLSRQCAEAGLESESESMFKLARRASTGLRRIGIDYTIYRLFVYMFGWVGTGRLASRMKNML
jgi:glycosyltransferase involved in cell wall biosynthesis